MPVISVILPAYNEEKRISKCIWSLLEQTFKDFEVIVVDDGSTDATPLIVKNIDDARIRLISQPNSGRAAARNNALAACQGKYVALQDADDWSEPDRLEKLISLAVDINSNKIPVIGSSFVFHQDNGKPDTIKSYPLTDKLIRRKMTQLVFRNALMPPTMLTTKDILVKLGGWRTKFTVTGEDSDLLSRLCEQPKVAFANAIEPVYHYTHNTGSITNKYGKSVPASMFLRYCERQRRRGCREPDTYAEYFAMKHKNYYGHFSFRLEYHIRVFIHYCVWTWGIAK